MKPLIDIHGQFIADASMMSAYREAIERAVRPGDLVLDAGAGTGVLGYAACASGARHVIAVERSEILEVARDVGRVNGLADRVTYVNRSTHELDVAERADVGIFSMLARFGVEDGILPTMLDARQRLLKPGATLIPASVELFLAPVEKPEWYAEHVSCWDVPRDGFSMGAARHDAVNSTASDWVRPESIIGDVVHAHTIAFDAVTSADLHCQASSRIRRPGVVHALAGWARWTFAPGVVRDKGPHGNPPWTSLLFPLAQPVPVRAADLVNADVWMDQVDDVRQTWAWRVRVVSEGVVTADYQQGQSHVPNRVAAGAGLRAHVDRQTAAVAASVLARFDGRQTMRTIADAVRADRPEAGADMTSVETIVARLVRDWSR